MASRKQREPKKVTPGKVASQARKTKSDKVSILPYRPSRKKAYNPARVTPQSLSDRSFEAKNRAFHTKSRMLRDNVSLREASRIEETTPETVLKYLPSAFRQSKSGRWHATKSDHYVRYLTLPGPHGPIKVRARGSEEAKLASAYLQSLGRWAKTEKPWELSAFHGKKIGDYELITASSALRPMRDAGLLQLDTLYASLKDIA